MSPRNTNRLNADRLFREHNERLYRTIVKRFRDRDLAEDACMFAWSQMIEKPPADDRYLVGWLTVVATNEALRMIAKTTAREADAEFVPDTVADSFDLDRHVQADEIRAAMADLKPQQRLVLGLWEQGYSYDEIVALTGTTHTWVNRHLAEGKEALRRKLTG